jgi:dTDP-4-dehydrorhamnose reductase
VTANRLRVGVTGQNGQVSLALARALASAGHDRVMFARPDVDLDDRASIRAAVAAAKPDIVINAAAYTAVDRAEDEPELAFRINRDGAGVVAAAAADIGAPILHVSTDYVFDGTAKAPYVEEHLASPLGVYGQSKFAGELAVAAANPRHVIVRTSWVCSPDGNNFMKTMLRLAGERPELRVVNDQHGSPTFADDLAAALVGMLPVICAAASGAPQFGTFHACNAGETTWHNFAREIVDRSEAFGRRVVTVLPISTAEFPTRAKRPAYSVLSTRKLVDVYGISLPAWRDGLDRTLASYLGA